MTDRLACCALLGITLLCIHSVNALAQDFDAPKAAPGDAATEPGADAPISPIETALWLSDQMKLVTTPTRLHYDFKRSGSFDMGFEDSVELDVTGVNADGSRRADVRFFSNERNQWTPPFESITGNPVLGLYLQGDTYEMNRLTQGHWRYFHRRIKAAFAEARELTPVEIEFEGRKLAGQQIRITPYAQDARRDRYERFADKYYVITVSEQVPGYLYEIHSVVPGEINPDGTRAAEPLIEERLTLTRAEPLPAATASTKSGNTAEKAPAPN